MGQADNIRRAISKKKMKVIDAERNVFVYGDAGQGIPGAMANGVTEQAAQSIYDEIVEFANYAFNKAHAVCYAVVSYQTAYLKCHYPRQYMAALMTSVLNSAGKISTYINECKDMGIPTLPPDINHSEDNFTVDGDCIRFGLGAVKGIGRGLIRAIAAKRQEGGPFRSLEDFLQRVTDCDVSKRTVESLIKCGAMDCFGYHRSELLAVYDTMMDSIAYSRKKNLDGQMGLFGADEETSAPIPIPKLAELSKADLMQLEKETTGIYLSGHPMDDYREILRGSYVVSIGDLTDEESHYADDQIVSIAGIVQTVKMKTTRNNSSMAYVTVEDSTGSIETIAFSNVLKQDGGYLKENAPVIITGRISLRDDKEPQIVINRIRDLTKETKAPAPRQAVAAEAPKAPLTGTLYLRLPSEEGELFAKIRAILNMFPGENQAVVYFADTKVRRGTRCALSPVMLQELKNVLSEENVVLK